MRVIPHIRTRRWIWLAVTLLIASAWIGGMRFGATGKWATGVSNWMVSLASGSILLARFETPLPVNNRLDHRVSPDWNIRWLPATHFYVDAWFVWVPLWIPTLILTGATMLAFRRARRGGNRRVPGLRLLPRRAARVHAVPGVR